MLFTVRLDISQVKKAVFHMLFPIIMKESKFIHDSLSLKKTLTFHTVIILAKSGFNKDKLIKITTTIIYS